MQILLFQFLVSVDYFICIFISWSCLSLHLPLFKRPYFGSLFFLYTACVTMVLKRFATCFRLGFQVAIPALMTPGAEPIHPDKLCRTVEEAKAYAAEYTLLWLAASLDGRYSLFAGTTGLWLLFSVTSGLRLFAGSTGLCLFDGTAGLQLLFSGTNKLRPLFAGTTES